MKKIILSSFILLLFFKGLSQDVTPFNFTKEWLSKIEKIAPTDTIARDLKKNILIFSLHTGYDHWTIPHTEAVIKLIAEKSNGFNVTVSKDIFMFDKKNLKKFDAVILNNNCSIGDKRNLFWDALEIDSTLSEQQRSKKANQLENNLLKYVKKGHGLMVLHGGIVMQNKSEKFGEMVGGNFDYHPKQQEIHVQLVDNKHPIVQGISSDGFSHIDEPYFFNNAYFDYNFRPLLYMKVNQLEGLKKEVKDNIKYISWIKRYGKGKVFYASPSHNAQSMENAQLLQFFRNGLLYVTGDLICDDSPIKQYMSKKNHLKTK